MIRRFPALLFHALVLFVATHGAAFAASVGARIGPWDVAALRSPPGLTWGARTGLVQEVYYVSEPFHGHPTRVFAWYARPERGPGPFPAMLLVHGGGGRAFADWATHWARRGFVALAMDLSGRGPDGPLSDGGPDQDDGTNFRAFEDGEVGEMGTYHAVAAILHGHGLLADQAEVNPRRFGLTGISWGGYLACLAAGVDDQLAAVVPVYGCGFLDRNSCWVAPQFDRMPPAQRERWVRWFDPSSYLGRARCPVLMLNGSNDFAYPLDSHRSSFAQLHGSKTLSIVINLPHGHLWEFNEVDAFIDHALRGGPALTQLGPLKVTGPNVVVAYRSDLRVKDASLHFTTDRGPWQTRQWRRVPAEVRKRDILAPLPAERPLTFFVSTTDVRGVRVSTPYQERESGR